MFNISKLNKISPIINDVLDEKYTIEEDSKNPHAYIVRSFKMHDMNFGDNLLAVARAGAGTNNIPISKLTEKGVVVFNTPGANANAVKELVLCGMLMAARNILDACKWTKGLENEGDAVPTLVEKGKSAFAGIELANKTIGLIGVGAIGEKVAKACHALEMHVLGCDPFLDKDTKGKMKTYVSFVEDIDEIYKKSDFISLHIPLLDTTREIINKSTINLMKNGVVLINMARGELVNINDIKEALANKKIRSYVIDFPNCQTCDSPNIIAIPHLGASTEESEENCAYMAASQLKDYLENGNIINSVNFPTVFLDKKEDLIRVAIAFNDIPGIKDKLKDIISSQIINELEIKTRKGLGYILADAESFDKQFTDEINKIKEVIFLRFL